MIAQIDIAKVLGLKAGHHLSEAHQLYKSSSQHTQEEAEACIEAVLLFQASLEAFINEEIETERKLIAIREEDDSLNKKFKSLSFKNKWEKTFAELGIVDSKHYLSHYLDFYYSFRIPITHPKGRYVEVDQFTFPLVYEGIKHGWKAAEMLAQQLGKNFITDSWSTFCGLFELPDSHRN